MHLTDMEVANNKAPVETSWIESNMTPGMEQLLELEKQYDTLNNLHDQAYRVRDKNALNVTVEAFAGLPYGHQVSFENHQGTITQKNHLSHCIHSQVGQIGLKYNSALENYVEDIKEDFTEKLKAYQKALTKLGTTDADIESPSNKTVAVNHAKIFEMFHVKDVFSGNRPLEIIRKEDTNIARLVTMVGTAVSRIKKDLNDLDKEGKLDRKAKDLPNVERMFLMFNRRAAVIDGQFDYNDNKTKGPKKVYNWKQTAIIIIGSLFMGPAGETLGKLQKPKDSTAKVENKLSDIHRFIRYTEGFQDNIDDLSGHIDELIKLFTKAGEHNQSALNRRAAPVMELAEFIVKHVTDITNGTDRLFSRLVRKN